jgi:hypothetical protein
VQGVFPLVWRKRVPSLLLAGTLLVASGCGNDDTHNRQTVHGTVSLDGAPLATGAIRFFPETQGAVATGADIKDGEFEIPQEQGLPAGTYKVSITATENIGPVSTDHKDLMENPPQVKSLIPRNYNTETTLKAEIDEGTENSLSFDLTSK